MKGIVSAQSLDYDFVAVLQGRLHSLYAPDEVGKAMGMSYLIKLPLIFGMAPLVALAVDHFGSYGEAFGILAVITAGGAVLCGAAMIVVRSGPRTAQAT